MTAGENSALSESPERQWFEGLKGRWHELWIRSLSVILGIGARVNPQQVIIISCFVFTKRIQLGQRRSFFVVVVKASFFQFCQ